MEKLPHGHKCKCGVTYRPCFCDWPQTQEGRCFSCREDDRATNDVRLAAVLLEEAEQSFLGI